MYVLLLMCILVWEDLLLIKVYKTDPIWPYFYNIKELKNWPLSKKKNPFIIISPCADAHCYATVADNMQTFWQKEKFVILSNFSFCHYVDFFFSMTVGSFIVNFKFAVCGKGLISSATSGETRFCCLIYWLEVSAIFKRNWVISPRPVHVFMCVLVFSYLSTPHKSLIAHLLKTNDACQAVTFLKCRKECWPSLGSN